MKTVHLSLLLSALILNLPAQADEALAKAKNCTTCHGLDKKIVGPGYKEIAAKLNISPETVKVHLTKGLQRCQAHFRNDERKPA